MRPSVADSQSRKSSPLELLDSCIASHRAGELEEWELQLVRRRIAECTRSETASREAVIEEIAKHIEDAPLTYMGPDPGGIKDLKFLIVAAIRDMKGKP